MACSVSSSSVRAGAAPIGERRESATSRKAQLFAGVHDRLPKCLRIDDAGQRHVAALTGRLGGRLELDRTHVEVAQDRSFDEGHILNVFEGNRFLDLDQDALAVAERLGGQLALEAIEIVARPPQADPEKPEQCQRNAHHGCGDREADRDHEIRPNQRIEGGAGCTWRLGDRAGSSHGGHRGMGMGEGVGERSVARKVSLTRHCRRQPASLHQTTRRRAGPVRAANRVCPGVHWPPSLPPVTWGKHPTPAALPSPNR